MPDLSSEGREYRQPSMSIVQQPELAVGPVEIPRIRDAFRRGLANGIEVHLPTVFLITAVGVTMMVLSVLAMLCALIFFQIYGHAALSIVSTVTSGLLGFCGSLIGLWRYEMHQDQTED